MPPRDTNGPRPGSASRRIYRCMLSYENITVAGQVFYHRKPLNAIPSPSRSRSDRYRLFPYGWSFPRFDPAWDKIDTEA
ncbi:hypothetical protein BSU04_12575 [Caballeronia sordidicola]|uniref:Uncharacterized protein n=1 Tax=Caballeronia sordidicola TaxID=196367 RepID=A0A226X556_CABSO|nr:hypothetical protein BSU04_12575 [Caballeronia sordidicola]